MKEQKNCVTEVYEMSNKKSIVIRVLKKISFIFHSLYKEKITIDNIFHKIMITEKHIESIKIEKVSSINQRRVSIFLSKIDFNYLYGGYFGMLKFAKLFHHNGYKVRILLTNSNEIRLDEWEKKITKYKGLEDIFDIFEFESVYNRDKKYTFYEDEELIATSWWTAHITEGVRKQLNKDKFIYFIQEFEPIFYEFGSMYALALESYTFPHFAVFSTKFILDYFKKESLGVFNKTKGIINSIYFENAIVNLEPSKNIATRKTKKLLFYFRPEKHATRNMFEMGFLALKQALKSGVLQNGNWEFYGMGSFLSEKTEIPILENYKLKIIPKTNLEKYKNLIPEFDIGLSLMLSPHPSLVPFEMCKAGLNVVTNSFENKTKEKMQKISSNFYVAEPTISSIAKAITDAVADIEKYGKRISGAKIQWPTDWNNSFNEEFKKQLFSFCEKNYQNIKKGSL